MSDESLRAPAHPGDRPGREARRTDGGASRSARRAEPPVPGRTLPGAGRALPSAAAILALALAVAGAPAHAQAPSGEVEFLDGSGVMPSGLPFSEAVRHDGFLHLSGMVGNVPGTLELAEGGIRGQARQVMENIRRVLEAHGSSLDRVVRCTVFLADIGEWEAFNDVYATFFEDSYPARSAMGVEGLALDARVEVECLAAA